MTATDTRTSVGASRPTAVRGDIEGLRAVAVGLVLLYHAGIPWVSGGYAGVDVFFVISGFLITSLLLRELGRTGSVSILHFYARRARRLLPAATLVLVFTALVGWWVLPGSERGNLATDVAAATLYVVNWALAWRSVDYLAEDAGVSPVQHYWSLSVEEQFYVVWPLMVLAGVWLARRVGLPPRRLVFGLLAVSAVASLVHSAVHTASSPATAYFSTSTRAWELAVGALLAFLTLRLRSLPGAVAEVLAAGGLAAVAVSAFVFTSATPWPGTAALLPTLGTAAVIAAGMSRPTTLGGRLLSLRPLTWVGGLSYSIYLWHWPLLILADARWPDIRTRHRVLLVVASIGLAWLTKRLVEDPIRFNRTLATAPRLALVGGAAAMSVSLLAATAVWLSVPRLEPQREVVGATALVDDAEVPTWTVRDEPQDVFATSGTIHPSPALAPEDVPSYYDDGCQVAEEETELAAGCSYGDLESETVVALMGDSKMGQWFPAFEAIAETEGWRLDLYLKSACAVSDEGQYDQCRTWNDNLLAAIRSGEVSPDVAVISQGRSALDSYTIGETSEELVDGMVRSWSALIESGTAVVALADNPTPSINSLPAGDSVYECVERVSDYLDCSFPTNAGRGTAALQEAAEALPDVELVDLNDWICPSEDCPPVIGDTLVYRQGSHLTATYVRSLTPHLHRALASAGAVSTHPADIGADVPQP